LADLGDDPQADRWQGPGGDAGRFEVEEAAGHGFGGADRRVQVERDQPGQVGPGVHGDLVAVAGQRAEHVLAGGDAVLLGVAARPRGGRVALRRGIPVTVEAGGGEHGPLVEEERRRCGIGAFVGELVEEDQSAGHEGCGPGQRGGDVVDVVQRERERHRLQAGGVRRGLVGEEVGFLHGPPCRGGAGHGLGVDVDGGHGDAPLTQPGGQRAVSGADLEQRAVRAAAGFEGGAEERADPFDVGRRAGRAAAVAIRVAVAVGGAVGVLAVLVVDVAGPDRAVGAVLRPMLARLAAHPGRRGRQGSRDRSPAASSARPLARRLSRNSASR
jgi:hypothetical protein